MSRYQLLKLGLPDQGAAVAFDQLPNDPAIWVSAHPDLRLLAPHAGRPLWDRWGKSRGQLLTTRQQCVDYGVYLPDDVLVKVDRASMAHSIEVRSPFLDYRLIEWAARLPRAALLNAREGKLPLRALAARLLPAAVARGAKRGFGVPLGDWFREPQGIAMVRERLLSREMRRISFLDFQGVERIIQQHQTARGRDFGVLLWRLLMLEAWARHYASRFYLGACNERLAARPEACRAAEARYDRPSKSASA